MVEVNGKTVTPGELTIMASGAVALVFSFFDFYGGPDVPEVELPTGRTLGGSTGLSAWSSGLFPVATLMVIFCVLMGLHVALTKFANVHVPETVAGFTWTQIHLVLGFVAALYAIAFLIVKKGGGTDTKIGFWMIFLACIGALVGAVLLRNEREGARPSPPSSPSPPAA